MLKKVGVESKGHKGELASSRKAHSTPIVKKKREEEQVHEEVTGFYVWQWEGKGVPGRGLLLYEINDAENESEPASGRLEALRRGGIFKCSLWVKEN